MVSLFRIDRTTFPPSLVKFDNAYVSFISFALAQHVHDNPVRIFGAESFRKNYEDNKDVPLKSRQARFRWQLAYTLLLDPSLQQHRRHNVNRLSKFVDVDDEKDMKAHLE